MTILITPDSRGRMALGKLVREGVQYAAEADPDSGVVTLTPSRIVPLDRVSPWGPGGRGDDERGRE